MTKIRINKKEKMWNINKKDYFNIYIGSFFSFFSALCGALLPFLLAKIINISENSIKDVNQNSVLPIGDIMFLLLIMLMAGFLGLIFTFFGRRYLAKFSTSKLAQIRRDVFIKIQYLSPQDLKKYKNNSLLTRMQLDNLNYATFLNFVIISIIPTIFRIFTFLIMCFVLNYIAALVLIGCAIIFYIIITIFSMNAEKSFIQTLELTDSLNKIIEENITGARVVKAFNLKERQRQRFIKINNFLVKVSTKAEKKVFAGWPFSLAFVASTSSIMILIFSGITWSKMDFPGISLNIGSVVAFINYSYLIMWSVFELIVIQIFRARSYASKRRIQEIINLKNNYYNENGVKFNSGDIVFENVSFKYSEESIDYVLKDISFTIKENTRVGIIGSTGSGKTTLINLITKLFDSKKGKISFNKVDIRDLNTKDFIKNISISFQQKYLFSGTIKSNIKFGNEKITDDEIIELLDITQMKSFVFSKKEKLNYKIEENGQNLSGGQRQRLSIARALTKNCKILIFDDSTSALDNITEKKILKSINQIKSNITQIFVAQKISTIQDMDQIIVLDKGIILGIGTHNELLMNCPTYVEIYKFQSAEANNV